MCRDMVVGRSENLLIGPGKKLAALQYEGVMPPYVLEA
jgi:hypothetical protein